MLNKGILNSVKDTTAAVAGALLEGLKPEWRLRLQGRDQELVPVGKAAQGTALMGCGTPVSAEMGPKGNSCKNLDPGWKALEERRDHLKVNPKTAQWRNQEAVSEVLGWGERETHPHLGLPYWSLTRSPRSRRRSCVLKRMRGSSRAVALGPGVLLGTRRSQLRAILSAPHQTTRDPPSLRERRAEGVAAPNHTMRVIGSHHVGADCTELSGLVTLGRTI